MLLESKMRARMVAACLGLFALYLWMTYRSSYIDDTIKVLRKEDDVEDKRQRYVAARYGDLDGGVEILHAVPSDNKPRAMMLCFHGCTHSGRDWFTLPEEVIIVKQALQADFAVLAVTSYNRLSGCWGKVDLDRLPKALDDFKVKYEWSKNLPMFAIGASSGGSMVTIIPTILPVRGIYNQIGRPVSDDVGLWQPPYPTTSHSLYMTRDSVLQVSLTVFEEITKDKVKRQYMFEAKPCRLTAKRLTDRIPDIDENLADTLVAEMVKRKLVGQDDLIPTERNVYSLVTSLPTEEMFFAIQEEYQVCFAQHQITSEYFNLVLADWITSLSTT